MLVWFLEKRYQSRKMIGEVKYLQTALRNGKSAGIPRAEATTAKARAVVFRTRIPSANVRKFDFCPLFTRSTYRIHQRGLYPDA